MKKLRKSRFLTVLFARKSVVLCTCILAIMMLAAALAPIITVHDPIRNDLTNMLADMSPRHPLGTDGLGRDVLTRLIHGGRISFVVGFVSVFIAGSIGMLVGLVSGMRGGIVDSILMRIIDAMSSIPMIILALFLGNIFGRGLLNICIAIGVVMIPGYARLTRGQVLTLKNADYVTAGTLCGASKLKNTIKHVFPNCVPYNIIAMTTSLGAAILVESALSYLGMGINPPTATWGSMVYDGYGRLATHPVLAIAPGVAIMIVVLCFSIVGDAVRDALDPKLRGTMGNTKRKRGAFRSLKAVALGDGAIKRG